MKLKITIFGVLAAAAMCCGAAQPALAGMFGGDYSQRPVSTYPGLPETILNGLGGPVGLQLLMNEFYLQLAHDNRINIIFAGGSPALRDSQKSALVQALLGKPTFVVGTQPGGLHQLSATQYNAIAEDLYLTLETYRVAYSVQVRMVDSLSAYAPALVSAYLVAQPAAGQLNGTVRVGAPSDRN